MTTATTIVGLMEHDPLPSVPRGAWPIDRSTGRPVRRTSFGVIVTRRWQNATSLKFHDKCTRFVVSCEGTLAQNVVDGLRKGDRVVVTGHIESARSDLVLYADVIGLALSKHQVHPEDES